MVGLSVAAVVYAAYGSADAAAMYLSSFLLECAISVDICFVRVLLFRAHRVPAPAQPRLLWCALLVTILSRTIVLVGAAALVRAHPGVLYLFAVPFVFNATAVADDKDDDNLGRWLRARSALRAIVFVEAVYAVDAVGLLSVGQCVPILVASSAMASLTLASAHRVLECAFVNNRLDHPRIAFVILFVVVAVVLFAHEMIDVPPVAMLIVIASVIAIGVVTALRPARSAGDRRPT